MRVCTLVRRLPWLAIALVGCADDSVGAVGTESDTDGTTAGSTATTTGVDGGTTAVTTDGVDTTGDSGTPDDTGTDGTATDDDTTTGGTSGTTGSPNVAPVAADDVAFATQSQALVIDVAERLLANDSDPNADTLTVVAFDAMSTASGEIADGEEGTVVYTPVAGFWGPDSFEYTIEDDSGLSATATVTVYVAPVAAPLLEVAAGTWGFAIDGEAEFDESGRAVSGAGDVNGDGFADLIVGAPTVANNGASSGRSYVVFGKADTAAVQLSDVAAEMDGFAIGGEFEADYSGISVSGAGDVNGDGMDDIIVGAFAADANGNESGRSYVVFGKADTAAVELSDITAGNGGFALNGEIESDNSGFSVSRAGDVNGDGMDDIVVGASGSDASAGEAGRTYVVFGKADTAAVQLGDIQDGPGGFVVDGEAALDQSGRAVAAGGDINGDGLDDIIVGANRADPNGDESGRTYVVFGKLDTSAVELAGVAAGLGGFSISGEAAADFSGRAVGGAGDVNADGLDDIVIGAYFADPNGSASGRTYVVFGKVDSGPVQLTAITAGMGGFVLNGEMPSDQSGWAVAGAGDVNADGMGDILLSAPGSDANGDTSGRSYLVFGRTDTAAVDLDTIGAGSGFVLDGEAADDNAGEAVSGAGDVNGDGMDDLIIGSRYADPNGEDSGRSYVVFGVPTADTCCGAHGLPGCTDTVVQTCVCDADADCCDLQWGQQCVDAATDSCGACGG